MTLLQLEVFERDISTERDTVVTTAASIEGARSVAWEEGFSAGWAECDAAQQQEMQRISEALSRQLSSLTQMQNALRLQLLDEVEPVVLALVGCALPAIARESLSGLLKEALWPLIEQAVPRAVAVHCAPHCRILCEAAMAALKRDAPHLALTLVEDASLTEQELKLVAVGGETRVDYQNVLARAEHLVRTHFDLAREEVQNG